MPAKVIIIGGGIIGLSSAFYLQEAGFDVTVIDRTDMLQGCSYGNAGYVCPSHFVPMAAPGIVKLGLKWMLNAKSPFYIQPRLNGELIEWGLKFMKSATHRHVERSAIPLRDIALLSQHLYESWAQLPGMDFAYEPKGLLELFKTAENAAHAEETVAEAVRLGLNARLLNKTELAAMEPGVEIEAIGAAYFGCDAQLYPDKLMASLLGWLRGKGVKLETGQPVTGFITEGNRIKAVNAGGQAYLADHVVLAAGAWSAEVARQLHLRLPMVGGRGYSVTFEDAPYKLQHAVILSEARVAISPMDGNKIRFGGTMEITGLSTPPRMQRVQGILESVSRYFPAYRIPMPAAEQVWYGYRPCSADGLPYIGNVKEYTNLTIATGHSMLGVSLGAGTGKLVSELVQCIPASMDLTPFRPDR